MARIISPTLFSKHFGIDQSDLDDAGLIDPFIDVDTQLFIDPVLLEKSGHPVVRGAALKAFRSHFNNFIRLLAMSKKENDAAWKAARNLLDLREPPENGLGYGGSGRSGSSRPEDVRLAIMRTAKEIVDLGASDPEMISLMGFFEEDIGPDTISDFTTRAIIEQLAQITEKFCLKHKIAVHFNNVVEGRRLPKFIDKNGADKFLVLVPRDVVRDLPIANDWSDIEKAAYESAKIRSRVNAMLSGIAAPTVTERKQAIRSAALESVDTFLDFLFAVKQHAAYYDPTLDALGYYKLKSILKNGFGNLVAKQPFDLTRGPQEVHRVALDALAQFKHHVEKGNLWEELWIKDKPKKERAAQLIFYAIAECFCIANNVDISPEANMGGGPVDFKFSTGFEARVIVEMKRSNGTVVHGYQKQLEIYKDTSRTNYGIFVVLDYGDLGKKLTEIQKIRADRIAAGELASEIIVVDATKKASPSKRGAAKQALAKSAPKRKK